MEYKAYRIVDGKPRNVIVDKNGKIVNKEPSKKELKGVEKEIRKPYDTMRIGNNRYHYTNEELLRILRNFPIENNGKTYDVKSSKFYKQDRHYGFNFNNKQKHKIEILYLLGFNENYTELEHAWRVNAPEFIDSICIGYPESGYKFDLENMKRFEVTDEIKEILKKM